MFSKLFGDLLSKGLRYEVRASQMKLQSLRLNLGDKKPQLWVVIESEPSVDQPMRRTCFMNLVMHKGSKMYLLYKFFTAISYLDVCFSEKVHFVLVAISASIFPNFYVIHPCTDLLCFALKRYE